MVCPAKQYGKNTWNGKKSNVRLKSCQLILEIRKISDGVIMLNILVREYRCSGGTDTANPAAGNR